MEDKRLLDQLVNVLHAIAHIRMSKERDELEVLILDEIKNIIKSESPKNDK